jgi:hypothetical protein
VFNKEGKRFSDKALGGTLAEVEKFTKTSKGEEMAFCRLWSGDYWAGPLLVPSASLALFNGTRDGIQAGDLNNLMDYFRLLAGRDRRKADLEREAIDANPYAAKVRQLAEENKTLAKRTKALTEARDNATGSRRNAITDELRALQIETAAQTRTLNEVIGRYNAWKAAHPATVAVAPEKDPEWRDLEVRRRMMTRELGMFGIADETGEAE